MQTSLYSLLITSQMTQVVDAQVIIRKVSAATDMELIQYFLLFSNQIMVKSADY